VGAVTLRARLLASLAYVLLLAILALLVPLVHSVRARVDAEVRTEALAQAESVATSAPGVRGTALRGLARVTAENLRGRVIIVGPTGRVRADSAGRAAAGALYAGRPEIAGALRGRAVQVERTSASLRQRLLATAVPIVVHGRAAGAVRVTQSVAAVHRAVNSASLGLTLVGGLVLALGLGAGALIAAHVARPVHRLAAVARRVESGDLDVRAIEEGSSEQRALARAFNDMTARVQRTVAGQRDFVADASHQLRTPLAGLRLRIEEAAASAPEPGREQLSGALREVDRMTNIVAELLVLSQAEEPAGTPQAVELADAVRAAAERWTPAARLHHARIVVDGGGIVWCDRADLDRILDALVENALAYGPRGQTVRIVARGGRVEVQDEGPGVAADEVEAVFARFHRGGAGRMGPPGTGLGLAIARELARRWRGDVVLAGTASSGGRAIVRLRGQEP
jgi:signal transduction histidine kinase